MAISELTEVVPPPCDPIATLDGGLWKDLEQKLGIQLPADWRDFGLCYGSGEFGQNGGYQFWNPFAPDTVMWIEMVLGVLRNNKEAWPEYGVPYDLHPVSPGLLPWGSDVNGSTYCWLTDGRPEEWPVVFIAHECEDRPEKFELQMTSFVSKLVSGELEFATVIKAKDRDNVFTAGRNQAEVAARLIASNGG